MKIIDVLRKIALHKPSSLTDSINTAIKEIKTYADQHYSNKIFYGNAALNRQLLLDP